MSEPNTRGLDTEWIADRLTTDTGRPAVHFEGFIGTGQIGRNARFRVEGADLPDTVVVKLPAADVGTRSIGFDQGLYSRECEFYTDLVHDLAVRTPTPLAVDIDEEALDFAIVLEDMAGSDAGDQMTEATDEELTLAIGQAAALHGPLWGADHPAFESMREQRANRSSTQEIISLFLPTVLDRLGDRLDEATLPVVHRFAETADAWVERPRTIEGLVHSDFRPDNFLYGRTPDAPPLAVVDWQTITLGSSVNDVSYLLGAAIRPERRREIEHDLLAEYRERLTDHGVHYDADECWDEYAFGSLHGIAVGILATVMATETDRGNDLFALMLNRHAAHAIDVDVLDRVDALI